MLDVYGMAMAHGYGPYFALLHVRRSCAERGPRAAGTGAVGVRKRAAVTRVRADRGKIGISESFQSNRERC